MKISMRLDFIMNILVWPDKILIIIECTHY